MTENEKRGLLMFMPELLSRYGKTSLVEIREDQLESFRYQGNIHVYDGGFLVLKDQWRQALDEKQRAMRPPEMPVVPTKTESHWRKILRERFGIKV